MLKKFAIFLVILIGFVVYFPSLKYGFSQDDFIHLSASQADSLASFVSFFDPNIRPPDIFFYRPLSTEAWFFINNQLFDLNPFPFHLEALILHLINTWLFFKLVGKVWKNPNIALLSSLLYTISAAHFLSLFYISAFQQIARTFFILLGILAYINYQEQKNKLALAMSVACFTLSLLSKETSLIFPFLIIPLEIIRQKQRHYRQIIKETLNNLIPFFGVLLIYIVIRITGFNAIFNQGSYSTDFSPLGILQNLKWYLLWSFGLPEMISSLPSLKPYSLISFWHNFTLAPVIIITFVICFLATISSVLLQYRSINYKILLCSLLLFLIPLSPILILRNHLYPQYLDLAFLGFLPLIISFNLSFLNWKSGLMVITIGAFAILQVSSLQLSQQTHWTTHRSQVADFYRQMIAAELPAIPAHTTIAFQGDRHNTRELSIALAYSYGPKIWFPNQINRVLYLSDSSFLEHDPAIVIFPVSKY